MKYTSLLLLINLFYTSNLYPEEFGEKIYQDSCANCHENELLRAPNFAALKLIGKEGLLNSLTNGSMQEVGNTLKKEELIAVINFLSPTEKNNSRSSTDQTVVESTDQRVWVLQGGSPTPGGEDHSLKAFQPPPATITPRAPFPWYCMEDTVRA